jgi:Phage integrase, N-terminal SAM-like domain
MEEAYVQWVKRFVLFHGKRHPEEMAAREVEAFLTHLEVEGQVAASTKNKARMQHIGVRSCKITFTQSFSSILHYSDPHNG